jgi:hypothetical protein
MFIYLRSFQKVDLAPEELENIQTNQEGFSKNYQNLNMFCELFTTKT